MSDLLLELSGGKPQLIETSEKPVLTPLMYQVLDVMVKLGGDPTLGDVAVELGLSARTVGHVLYGDTSSYEYTGGLTDRLGVARKREVVPLAVKLGLIVIDK